MVGPVSGLWPCYKYKESQPGKFQTIRWPNTFSHLSGYVCYVSLKPCNRKSAINSSKSLEGIQEEVTKQNSAFIEPLRRFRARIWVGRWIGQFRHFTRWLPHFQLYEPDYDENNGQRIGSNFIRLEKNTPLIFVRDIFWPLKMVFIKNIVSLYFPISPT